MFLIRVDYPHLGPREYDLYERPKRGTLPKAIGAIYSVTNFYYDRKKAESGALVLAAHAPEVIGRVRVVNVRVRQNARGFPYFGL